METWYLKRRLKPHLRSQNAIRTKKRLKVRNYQQAGRKVSPLFSDFLKAE